MFEDYLTEEESGRLENCAQSSTTPQLWSPDGGEPVSISDIVKSRGMATDKGGQKYRPKKWTPIGLDSIVKDWKPSGNADDATTCECKKEDCEACI